MIERFGADHFLYGSDYPMWDPEQELRRFLALGLGKDVEDAILYGNFMELFGLSDENEPGHCG